MANPGTPIEQRGLRPPRGAGLHRLGGASTSNDPTIRIVESRRGRAPLRHGPHPRLGEGRLARGPQRPAPARLPGRRALRGAHARARGSRRDTTVVFYGDKNNWWATYALWVFRLFGHTRVKVMDGGRKKWEAEGRPMTTEVPAYPDERLPRAGARTTTRSAPSATTCCEHVQLKEPLVDVRSPEEYSGEQLHMPDYPQEGAMRGGHIPGARSVPWARAVNPDTGEFLDADELRAIYEQEAGLRADDDVIAYCRIGERSSHTLVRPHLPAGLRQACGTTTAAGRSGATRCACRSRSREEGRGKREEGEGRGKREEGGPAPAVGAGPPASSCPSPMDPPGGGGAACRGFVYVAAPLRGKFLLHRLYSGTVLVFAIAPDRRPHDGSRP